MNLQKIAKQLFDSDPNAKNANVLNSAKEKLELLYEENLQGIIVRAQAHWWEHGEKRKETMLKDVRKLKTSGSIIVDPFNILSEQKGFYQELYTCRSQVKNADNNRAT